MSKWPKIFTGFVVALGLLGLSQAASASSYTVKSGRTYNSRIVRSKGWRLWNQPYTKQAKALGKTGKLSGQLVQVNQVAKQGNDTYFQISRRGHNYGWLNAQGLKKTSRYVLPYTYTSQLYPLYAPNACEAASMKMALSVGHRDQDQLEDHHHEDA